MNIRLRAMNIDASGVHQELEIDLEKGYFAGRTYAWPAKNGPATLMPTHARYF